ncbi:hypothetical protein DFH07DRAFT_974329 [Mycena maculata]|uniref:Uncharacterized protein n=1 Tax=Mycena maculata TaxID=230809 RepID=A0AAD7H8X7_9AGAR|nr:hypothetical protein DFH07DRAFT_974329 [Mycena maculata]
MTLAPDLSLELILDRTMPLHARRVPRSFLNLQLPVCPLPNPAIPVTLRRSASRAVGTTTPGIRYAPMERVSESYSDEDSDASLAENEDTLLSEEEQDVQAAPDLDELINGSTQEDIRLHTMRGYAARPTLHYYSMRIVADEEEADLETLGSHTKTSVTESASPSTEGSPAELGYNPGPVCIVCHDCALVCRSVPATPENGLPEGCIYSVCEHLTNVGLDPGWVALPASPHLPTIALPPASKSYASEAEGPASDDPTESDFEDTFEVRTIIDITASYPAEYESAELELRDFERARELSGRRPLTALEYDVNLKLLHQYRYYSTEEADRDEEIANWSRQADERLRRHPVYGAEMCARDALDAEQAAREDEDRVAMRGPGTEFVLEDAQSIVLSQLGPRAREHELQLQILDQGAHAIVLRGMIRGYSERCNAIANEIHGRVSQEAEDLFEHARTVNRSASSRVSYDLALIQSDILALQGRCESERRNNAECARAVAALDAEVASNGTRFSLSPPTMPGARAADTTGRGAGTIDLTTNSGIRAIGLALDVPSVPESGNAPTPSGVPASTVDLGLDEQRVWRQVTPFSTKQLLSVPLPERSDDTATNDRQEDPDQIIGDNGPNRVWPFQEFHTIQRGSPPITDEDFARDYEASNPGSYSWQEDLDRAEARHNHLRSRSWIDHWETEDDPRFHAHRVDDPTRKDEIQAAIDNPDTSTDAASGEQPAVKNIVVRESFDSTSDYVDLPRVPHPDDEVIVCSVVMTGAREAEQMLVMVNRNSNVYYRVTELPAHHYLHPDFRPIHEAAMSAAVHERNQLPGNPRVHYASRSLNMTVSPDRQGMPDPEPRLLPGFVFHERLASRDPEEDDETAMPGFRTQFLAARIENSSTIRRPDPVGTIGLLDQPLRPRKEAACIAVMANINGVDAYVLVDSGSTTNSMTPEFAHATRAPRISLTEQVTLQLGCGYVYFDQVNLDRYDCIIGTPLLNRHGGVIDFARRELRLSNGRVVTAIPLPDEVALVAKRMATKREPSYEEILDEDEENSVPNLPWDYESIFETTAEEVPNLEPDWDGSDDNTEDEYIDAPEEIGHCDTCYADELEYTFTPVLHMDFPQVPLRNRAPCDASRDPMPGLVELSVVSAHSSTRRVSWRNEEDPHNLNDEALTEAIAIMHMCTRS